MIANLLATLLSGLRAGSPVKLSARISVGMAAHGNAVTTRKALTDLFSSAAGDFELILVDDMSADDTLDVYREARRRHANTRIFSFDSNLEYCQSLNAFLSHARGDLLLFLSNDIFVNPSYLRQLLKAAADHPDCGILRGCSNFVDNSSPLHNIPVDGFSTRQAYLDFAASIARRHRAEKPVDDRFLVGDAFLVSRRVIDRIGTIDTRFVGYCGDQDFGLRAKIAGFRVALVRSAFAFHLNHANFSYLPAQEQKKKSEARVAKVLAALRTFRAKYAVGQDGSVHDIPWEQLEKQSFEPARHRVEAGDYSRYLLPAHD